VVLTVEDDGRGIDPALLRQAAARSGRFAPNGPDMTDEEILDLVFSHGFSTREQVTSLSGRGVGLGVVRRQIEGLGGDVRVESTPGQGTRFVLHVPFTISKERSLVVEAGSGLFGFAARTVHAVLGVHELPERDAERRRTLSYHGETMPLVSLAHALELPESEAEAGAIVLDLSGRRYAATVPGIVGDTELIRRPADALLGNLTGVAATALLDDGRLVLLLDLGFLQRALRDGSVGKVTPNRKVAGPRRRRVLVVDDSLVVCQVVEEILVSAGFAVELAHDGSAALAAVREREPDLVLSDVEMPKMGGLELLTEIRKRTQRLPVIMLTTRGSAEDRKSATALGANAYLLKTGFKGDDLLDVVLRFLPPASAEVGSSTTTG
jgi:CheY-like chemotaxis protein